MVFSTDVFIVIAWEITIFDIYLLYLCTQAVHNSEVSISNSTSEQYNLNSEHSSRQLMVKHMNKKPQRLDLIGLQLNKPHEGLLVLIAKS